MTHWSKRQYTRFEEIQVRKSGRWQTGIYLGRMTVHGLSPSGGSMILVQLRNSEYICHPSEVRKKR